MVTVSSVTDRDLDLVIFGATGVTGRLVAAHVARHAPPGLRVALGGRSLPRLYAARAKLPGRGQTWGFIGADSGDARALGALARRTRAVATTVGPYGRHGHALAAACAAAGTDYADLTGEVPFMRSSIDANEATARDTGARLVHACGFDSVPSDLGVWALHRHAEESAAGDLTRVTGLLTGASGGFSGGTVDSMRLIMSEAAEDRRVRRLLADPHALDPSGSTVARPGPADTFRLHWDPELGYWMAPFVMSTINTRVVRRSHALLGGAYGPDFRYREAVGVAGLVRGAPAALAVTAATAGLTGAMASPRTRRLVDRFLPAPGEGPSEAAMARGRFRMRLIARTTSGRTLTARVGADLDPGYGGTAVMFGQAAIALALGEGRAGGGVLTPAVALGDALVARLRACGFRWEVSG